MSQFILIAVIERILKDMFKKYVSLALVGLLLNLTFYSTAMANTEKNAKFAEKIKASIAKLGIGKESRVKVKLRDKTKINGYISEITEDSFTVVNEKTNSVTKIPYSQVKQVKGSNLSLGVRIAIVFAVFIAIGVLFALVNPDGEF